jgi:sialic acid synthase SpsE
MEMRALMNKQQVTENIEIARKSIVAKCNIKKGEIVDGTKVYDTGYFY